MYLSVSLLYEVTVCSSSRRPRLLRTTNLVRKINKSDNKGPIFITGMLSSGHSPSLSSRASSPSLSSRSPSRRSRHVLERHLAKQSGILHVQLHSASGLPAADDDASGSADPYMSLSIGSRPKPKMSAKRMRTLDPQYEETLTWWPPDYIGGRFPPESDSVGPVVSQTFTLPLPVDEQQAPATHAPPDTWRLQLGEIADVVRACVPCRTKDKQ